MLSTYVVVEEKVTGSTGPKAATNWPGGPGPPKTTTTWHQVTQTKPYKHGHDSGHTSELQISDDGRSSMQPYCFFECQKSRTTDWWLAQILIPLSCVDTSKHWYITLHDTFSCLPGPSGHSQAAAQGQRRHNTHQATALTVESPLAPKTPRLHPP